MKSSGKALPLLGILLVLPFVAAFPELRRNSACFDEPMHLPLGAAALEKGWWDLAPSSPPLAPIVQYIHVEGDLSLPDEKPAGAYPLAFHVLQRQKGHYQDVLTQARCGSLWIFFSLALLTGVMAQRLWGTGLAALAVMMVMSPVVAHAFLLGTDLMFTLGFMGGVWSLRATWLRQGLWPLAAGVIALATLGKFTAAILWPALMLILVLKRQWSGLVLSHLLALGVIHAFYGFPMDGVLPGGFMASFDKLRELMAAPRGGYFLGEARADHPLAYFPMLVLLKTPLPVLAMFLLLAPHGGHFRSRSFLALILAVAGYWLFMVGSNAMLLGDRFILPAFVVLAMAVSIASLGRFRWAFWALWAVAGVELSLDRGGPVGRFNQLLWTEPERVFADSAVDWGQDLVRLRQWQEGQAVSVPLKVFCWGLVPPETYGIHTSMLSPPVAGDWVAVSRNLLAGSGASIPTPKGFAVVPAGTFSGFAERARRVAEVGHGLIIFEVTP
ncbi:MAG: hypothetical protein AB7F75_04480 [Planctomycetota bacterium]